MEAYELVRLTESDGSWQKFCDAWTVECAAHEEEFEQYATASIPVLQTLAAEDQKDAHVFALVGGDGRHHAVWQANSTLLPGYNGKVLRIRHLLTSPAYDFGDFSIDDYSQLLSRVYARVLKISIVDLPSPHIKMHLRSPADMQFFREVGAFLRDSEIFTAVEMRGAWLYISKSPDMVDLLTGVENVNEPAKD